MYKYNVNIKEIRSVLCRKNIMRCIHVCDIHGYSRSLSQYFLFHYSQNTDMSSLTALSLSTSTAKRTYSAWNGCSLRSVTIIPLQ